MISFDKIIPGIIGALIGVAGAFAITTITRWRENEKYRSETKAYLNLFFFEVQQRHRILCNGHTSFDTSNDPETGDAVKAMNLDRNGVTFDFANELIPFKSIFEKYSDRLLSLRGDLSTEIARHYMTTDEILDAQLSLRRPPLTNPSRASAILSELRDATAKLSETLGNERSRYNSRNFLCWLILWIFGKS